MEWKKNSISERYLKHTRQSSILTNLLALCIIVLTPIILYFTRKPDLFKLIFFEILGITLLGTMYLNERKAILKYPKYIKWDKKGIYVINFKGKKEFTLWKDVKHIKKLKEIVPRASYAEDFVLEIKRFRYPIYILDPNIGEEIYHEWMKHREE